MTAWIAALLLVIALGLGARKLYRFADWLFKAWAGQGMNRL